MLNLDPSEGWITLKDGRRLPRTIFNKYNDKKIRYYNGGGGNKHKSPLRRLGEKVIAQRHSEEYKDKKKKEIEAAAQERAKILLEKSHQDDIIYDYLNAEYLRSQLIDFLKPLIEKRIQSNCLGMAQKR